MIKFNSIVFFILGIFSILLTGLLIISFNPTLSNSLVSYNLRYGDLYQMAKVSDFKFTLPPSLPQPGLSSIKDADIIIMGDSFFNVSPGYQYFAKQIQNDTNFKVHNYNIQGSGELWRKTNPIEYLREENFKSDGKKRILILESVDRGLMFRYESIQKNNLKKGILNNLDKNDKNPPQGAIELFKLNNNHLRLEGWGADGESGSPLKEVIIMIDRHVSGQAITGYKRPDIASHYKKNSWVDSGWSFDMDLNLPEGKHVVSALLIDNNGNKFTTNTILVNINFLEKVETLIIQTDLLIKNKLKSLDYLITENPISFFLNETINTSKYRLFGQISPLTPRYSLNPKVLFYKEEVSFFENPLSFEEIVKIADNLSYISTQLKSDDDIDFIFIPMPTKYTIYHEKNGSHTVNNFFSLLFKELDKRNVQYVDFYTSFKSSKNSLYFPSDTHWNKTGINIGIDKTLEKIKSFDIRM